MRPHSAPWDPWIVSQNARPAFVFAGHLLASEVSATSHQQEGEQGEQGSCSEQVCLVESPPSHLSPWL